MKPYLFLSCLLALPMLSSCDKDGYNEVTRTIPGPTITLITNNADGTVTVNPGSYLFNITMTDTEATGSVTSPALIANNTSLAFTSDVQTYKSTNYDVYLENVVATAGTTGMSLNNSQFQALYLYDKTANPNGYYYNTAEVGEYTFVVNPYSPLYITLARYNIGSAYTVHTFPINSFFKGTTTTTYPQSETPYQTQQIMYRVMIDRDSESGELHADMLLYDAKFSGVPAEPTKVAILVPGLDVNFEATGVTISGKNITPLVYESGEYVPNETYIFNDITFKTTNSLYTSASIDYTVMGVFHGSFSGSYLDSYFMK